MINVDEMFEKYGFKLTNNDFIFKVYKNNITKEKIICCGQAIDWSDEND